MPGAHAKSTERTLLDILAGAPKYLVYLNSPQLPASGHVDVAPINIPRTHLFALTKSGHTSNLGHAPRGLQPRMSVSGSMLTGTANRFQFGGAYGPLRGVYWWNLSNGHHGKIPVLKVDTYQTSSPHGALVASGDVVREIRPSGKTRSLGVPFPGGEILRAISDGHGVAVLGETGGSRTIAYRTFKRSDHFQPLAFTTTAGLLCDAVDAVAVACHTEDSEGDLVSTVLVPVDGSAATEVSGGGYEFGLIGDTAIWPDQHGLGSISLGDSTIRTGPNSLSPSRNYKAINGTNPYSAVQQFAPQLVGALGGVAIMQHAKNRVALAHSVRRGHKLFSVPWSPAAVSAFGLTKGRIAYAGDERTAKRGSKFSSYVVSLRHSRHGPAFGKQRLLKAGSDYVLAGASKAVTVYAVHSGQEHSDLKIVFRGKTHTVHHIPFDSYLDVAGTRVMFAADRAFSGASSTIYNAATGHTKTVKTHSNCCKQQPSDYGTTPALSGSSVFYMAADGSIRRHALRTGKQTKLSGPSDRRAGGIVFASGHHVAWTAVGAASSARTRSYVKDLRSHKPAERVADRIVGLSTAGALTTTGDAAYQTGVVGFRGPYSLREFDGKTTKVLSHRTVFLLPRIVGRTMAWVNAAGRLQVKRLST